MLLNELLSGVEIENEVALEAARLTAEGLSISYLSCSTSDIKKDTLFFCFKGAKFDSHDFCGRVAADGGVALVVERLVEGCPAVQILVKDARAAMAIISGNFYGNPVKKMKLVCITGTNGKTTTAFILRSIFKEHGVKTGLIGTTAYYVDELKYAAELTTPDPITLHRLFFEMYGAGCRIVLMELSAHAIALKKMAGIVADIVILTNVTQDHLDFFETFENYKNTKLSFFDPKYARLAIVNADDMAGEFLYKNQRLPTASYGYKKPSDVFGIDFCSSMDGIKYAINLYDKICKIQFKLPGLFNMYNTMAAAVAARFLGADIKTIARGIARIKRIDGRFDIIKTRKGVSAVVDYAHTPDGIKNILSALSEIKGGGKIITVFGCGGNRDKSKRRLMGEAAYALSDFLVITSDNPRFEPPADIINDIICPGFEDTKYIKEENRTRAIEYAINKAQGGDIVAILGKGAEAYQEIGGIKHPYDDYEIVARF